MKKSLPLLLAAVIASAAGYWAATELRRSPPTVASTEASSHDAIDFELPNLDGKRRSLKAWRGKIVLLNFWAPWCAPCREEIPLLMDLQKRYRGRGLQVVGIAIDDRDNVVHFRDEMSINYPILVGQDDAITLMTRYGNRIGSLPFSVTINREGRIVARKLGVYRRTELEDLLRPLLASA